MSATRKVNDGKDDGAVTLRATAPLNEFLLYKVTVQGAQPKFSLVESGTKKVLMEAPPVQQTYQRKWPKAGQDSFQAGDVRKHVLGMSFLKAVSYRFVVEHYDSEGTLIKVLTDVTWSSQQPESNRFEPFTVSVR